MTEVKDTEKLCPICGYPVEDENDDYCEVCSQEDQREFNMDVAQWEQEGGEPYEPTEEEIAEWDRQAEEEWRREQAAENSQSLERDPSDFQVW